MSNTISGRIIAMALHKNTNHNTTQETTERSTQMNNDKKTNVLTLYNEKKEQLNIKFGDFATLLQKK